MLKEDFIKWYKTFREKAEPDRHSATYGLKKDWHPDPEEWFDKVNKNHDYLRNKLGGVSKVITVDSEEDKSRFTRSIIDPLVKQLDAIVPDYRPKYALDKGDFYNDKYPKRINNGISVAKHILGYIKRGKIPDESARKLMKFVSELGQTYKNLATTTPKINVTISTDPRAFCMLGNFRIDQGPCFRENGMNTDKKYTYGAYPESFIYMVHNTPTVEFELPKVNNVISRGLGIVTQDGKRLNCSNPYGTVASSQTNALALAGHLVNIKDPQVLSDAFTHEGGINYINGPTYSVVEKSKEAKQYDSVKFDAFYSKKSHTRDSYANWD